MAVIDEMKDRLCITEDITQSRKDYLESFSRDFGLMFIDDFGNRIHNLMNMLPTNSGILRIKAQWKWGVSCLDVCMDILIDFEKNQVSFSLPFRQANNTLRKDIARVILTDFIQKYNHIMSFAKMRLHNDEVFRYKDNGVWEYVKNDHKLYGQSLGECRAKYKCIT